MEYRNINLTVDEIDLVIEALEVIYLRKVKKAHLMAQPRNTKIVAELGFCQTLMQKLMALRNYVGDTETPPVVG